MTSRTAVLTLCAIALAPLLAQAQSTWPSRPVRLISPFAPGGGADITSRAVAQRLSISLGQQVLVENRGGAGGMIGVDIAAKSPADGYTMVYGSVTSLAINPAVTKDLPYDPVKDFAPVSLCVTTPLFLVVHPSVPAKNVKELIALAKAKPGSIIYASGGNGSTTHLAAELLASMGGVKMTHVPYKGANPATLDLLGGRVSCMFGTILPTLPHVKAGKLRALGVSSPKRTDALPDVPAIAETLPGFEAVSFYGVAVPSGVPKPVMAMLNAEIARIITAPEARELLRQQGADAVGDSQAEFTAFFNTQINKWAKLIREAGIQPE